MIANVRFFWLSLISFLQTWIWRSRVNDLLLKSLISFCWSIIVNYYSLNYIRWWNMEFNIFTPLTYVLSFLCINLMTKKSIKYAYHTIILGPFLVNIYFYLCERGFIFDNVTQEEIFSFFYSSFITMISAIITCFIYRFIKKGS